MPRTAVSPIRLSPISTRPVRKEPSPGFPKRRSASRRCTALAPSGIDAHPRSRAAEQTRLHKTAGEDCSDQKRTREAPDRKEPLPLPEGVQKYMRSNATSISSTAAPIRSSSQKRSDSIPEPPGSSAISRRPPTVGVAANMLWVQPPSHGDSGATSLVTCLRCRLPTSLPASDRLCEFSQPIP